MKLRRSNLHAIHPATQLAALADVFSVVLFFVVLTTTFVTLRKVPETLNRGEAVSAHILFVKDAAYILRDVKGRETSVVRDVLTPAEKEKTQRALWDVLLRAKTEAPQIDRMIVVPAPNVPFEVALQVLQSVQKMPARFFGGDPISLFPKANFGEPPKVAATLLPSKTGKEAPSEATPATETKTTTPANTPTIQTKTSAPATKIPVKSPGAGEVDKAPIKAKIAPESTEVNP